MIFFRFFLSGLSNRIMRKIFSHWRLEPVYFHSCTVHSSYISLLTIQILHDSEIVHLKPRDCVEMESALLATDPAVDFALLATDPTVYRQINR